MKRYVKVPLPVSHFVKIIHLTRETDFIIKTKEALTEQTFFTIHNKRVHFVRESRLLSQREKLHSIFHSHNPRTTSYGVNLPEY